LNIKEKEYQNNLKGYISITEDQKENLSMKDVESFLDFRFKSS
jgi:hypothetical protein